MDAQKWKFIITKKANKKAFQLEANRLFTEAGIW